jgi:predicted hydrocarbon binding protein
MEAQPKESIFGMQETTRVQRRKLLRSWALAISDEKEFETTSHFFEFNPRKGMILNKQANLERVFMLGADSWADMESGLLETFSSGSDLVLMSLGRSYGASIAKRILPISNSVTVLKNVATMNGLGVLTIRLDEETNEWIRVNAKDCGFCHGHRNNHQCNFLSGLILGASQIFYSKNYIVIRNKCYNTEKSHSCEIVLQETYYDPVRNRRLNVGRKNNPLGEEFL